MSSPEKPQEFPIVFKEKLKGRKVVWSEKAYLECLNGTATNREHPEVGENFDKVKRAVEDPHFVNKDRDYPNRKCYYNAFSGRGDYVNMHMKVVIEERGLWHRRVITAYFLYAWEVPKDEKLIYDKHGNKEKN